MLRSTRPAKCAYCRLRLDWLGDKLHDACMSPWIADQIAKQSRARAKRQREAAKVEREVTKAKKAELKPRSKWLAECQQVINRYVRIKAFRNGEGCYTCGATPQQKWGGTYDAGHLRSVGSAPHLRFYIPQIRLQCVPCNRHKGGMALAFRKHLVQEHGQEWVDRLEAMQSPNKYSIDYLTRLKAVMGKKLRRLESRAKLR